MGLLVLTLCMKKSRTLKQFGLVYQGRATYYSIRKA